MTTEVVDGRQSTSFAQRSEAKLCKRREAKRDIEYYIPNAAAGIVSSSPVRSCLPNRYMWASIILAHDRLGQPVQAVRLCARMRELNLKPDNYVFVAVLKACATAKDLSSGRRTHADILGTAGKPDMYE